jgi:hypothetical protein
MKGTVRAINPRNGFIAIETENGDFSLFEASNPDDFGMDDAVAWVGSTPLGGETIVNWTRNKRVRGYFQDHQIAPVDIRTRLTSRPISPGGGWKIFERAADFAGKKRGLSELYP